MFPRIIILWEMKQRFSQELRDRCKAYFQKRCALTISDDEADEYLDSLADFINAFDKQADRLPP
ncbi:MAG: hypothetical protein ACSLEX_03040 [Minisyncoccota bacterium]